MLKELALNLINIYQRYISITLPCSCRFLPTCSEFSQQAIIKYGFFRGMLKGAKRLLYCHPFSGKSGDDPLV